MQRLFGSVHRETTVRWPGRGRFFDTLGGVALTIGILMAFVVLMAGSRPLDAAYMSEVIGRLARATQLSVLVTVVSFAAGLPIGFLVGWARTRGSQHSGRATSLGSLSGRFVGRIADGYVELMRGTPLFLQIIFMWYLFLIRYPLVENLALIAGTLAMTVNTGGYQGEIFRGGFQAVHAGQLEAARAIGLTRGRAMRYVVLPQALRLVIPPLTNEFIGLFKASSLLFFIGVQELTFTYKQLANFEARVFELFALVTLLYLAVTVPLSRTLRYLERRFRIPGLGMDVGRAAERVRGPRVSVPA